MEVIEKTKPETELDTVKGSAEHKKKHKLSKYWLIMIIYSVIIVSLNLLAKITSLSDFYDDNIFRYISQPYCRFTGLFPFSVGEVLIPLAILIVLVAVVTLILLPFLRKKDGFKKFANKYLKSTLAFVLTVAFIMTLNCNILYCTSKLDINGHKDKKYTVDDIEALRNYVVEQCNNLSEKMERDENGYVIYDGDVSKDVKTALNNLSDEFPRLNGYYPNAKPVMGSYFMYQSGIIGVYFPFTMEANYNTYTSTTYTPEVIAHELSHLKGYIYEDEANFIAYLACINSDNDMLKYSGYLSVLNYTNNDYYDCVDDERYSKQIAIDKKVSFDNYCYDAETQKFLKEKKSVIKDEVMENISDTITDTYLDYYEAEPNYSEVTLLMLQYYDGVLY